MASAMIGTALPRSPRAKKLVDTHAFFSSLPNCFPKTFLEGREAIQAEWKRFRTLCIEHITAITIAVRDLVELYVKCDMEKQGK